jgi:RNA polymerase sigma-70 factor (family 1)
MQKRKINNESLLVHNLAKGNLLAFNTLYNIYSKRLYRFALGYMKTESEAEELVQEVFTIIWDKRGDIKEELSFKSFLFTIAFNIIKKHFRKKAYLSKYITNETCHEVDIQTDQKITYDSLYKYLTELLNQLPDRRREIFIKSRFDGLSIKEISEELNISHKTVENHLTSALKFLRSNFSKENLLFLLFFSLFISS